jgi:hypothetical protein
MSKITRMLRTQQEVPLNCFRAKGEISAGAGQGLNNKIRVVTKRSYGLRTCDLASHLGPASRSGINPSDFCRGGENIFVPVRALVPVFDECLPNSTTALYEPLSFRQSSDILGKVLLKKTWQNYNGCARNAWRKLVSLNGTVMDFLRHATFLGRRDDREPREVVKERSYDKG